MGPFAVFLILLLIVIIGGTLARRAGFMSYDAQLLKEHREKPEAVESDHSDIDIALAALLLLIILLYDHFND